jgi:putative methyltransferase (TIGR04325 family)
MRDVVRAAKDGARLLLPPIVADPLRRRLAVRAEYAPDAEWAYLPGGWPEGESGWDSSAVADTQLARWPEFVASLEGPQPIGLSNEAAGVEDGSYRTHNTLMTFGYVLARVAHGRDHLSILDWGGGIGHYHAYAQTLLPGTTFDYHVFDVPELAAAGARLSPEIEFSSDREHVFGHRYDLVLASASLHYSPDWQSVLRRLLQCADGWAMITRVPVVHDADSYVVLQRAARHGYDTEYAGWFIRRADLLDVASQVGARLEREFLIDERPYVPGAPEQAEYRGFLFSHGGST